MHVVWRRSTCRANGTRYVRRCDDRFHAGLEFAGLLVAPIRLLFQRTEHHLVEPHVDLHFFRGRGEAADGQLAGEHLVEDHAQGIDVGAVVDLLRMLDLLGGHVLWRAHHLAGAGELCIRHTPCAVGHGTRSVPDTSDGRTNLARPKSAILTRPSLSNSMFSGLMSRWTTPWSWAYCRASQICGTMARASSGESLAGVQQAAEVHAVDELHEEVVKRRRGIRYWGLGIRLGRMRDGGGGMMAFRLPPSALRLAGH